MVDTDKLITVCQEALAEMREKVEQGGLLTAEEIHCMQQMRIVFNEIRNRDIIIEYRRGTSATELARKWGISVPRVSQLYQEHSGRFTSFTPKQ